jgi:hypothetical protein
MPPKTEEKAPEKVRVKVPPGRTIHTGGNVHPFGPGAEFELGKDEADRLLADGHLILPDPAPEPTPPDGSQAAS